MIHGALSPGAGRRFGSSSGFNSGFSSACRVFARAGRGRSRAASAHRARPTTCWRYGNSFGSSGKFGFGRVLRPQPRKIFFRNPRHGIERQAQAHRGIAGNQPERVVIAQKPRAGHPALLLANPRALDRQRVADDRAESLLENPRDAVALLLVLEIGFFRRDVRRKTAFLPSVIKCVFVGGNQMLRIHADRFWRAAPPVPSPPSRRGRNFLIRRR